MKMSKLLNHNLAIISVITAIIIIAIVSVSVYAAKQKADVAEKNNVSTPTKVEAPKVELAPAVEAAPEVNTTSPSPVLNQTPTAAEPPVSQGQSAADAELDKNCGLVNDTIAHLRSTYTARGANSSNQDILNDLNTNPRNASARIYYQQCVTAGKTPAL